MRKGLFAKRRDHRQRTKALELDITSLLDILVILLVFLLKSYNASDLTVELAKNLTLPISTSERLGSHAIIVQVNRNKEIWINHHNLGVGNMRGEKIDILYGRLRELKDPKEKEGRINILLHKDLPYQVMRKVMHTAALAGFGRFKFIVQGKL